ncbi:MAG: hypothetical protein JWR24_2092, partial [Actinoallomurus sp.]|nr:hypothetical protein [Actinoallomurus sp.]
VLGDSVLFEVLYDADGTPYGARRIHDAKVIAETGKEIAGLHDRGEPLLDYFQREIAPLPPPTV